MPFIAGNSKTVDHSVHPVGRPVNTDDEEDATDLTDDLDTEPVAVPHAAVPRVPKVEMTAREPVPISALGVVDSKTDPDGTLQAQLHADQDESTERLRTMYSEKKADTWAITVAYGFIGVFVLTVLAQIGARVFQCPAWAPAAILANAQKKWAENVKAWAAFVVEWVNPLMLWNWLQRVFGPIATDFKELFGAYVSFIWSLFVAAVSGFIAPAKSAQGILMLLLVGASIVLIVLIVLEVLGMVSGYKPIRPSFWSASISNSFYLITLGVTKAYCSMIRLVSKLRETIELIAKQFPWLYRVYRKFFSASRFILLGIRDFFYAIPYGLKHGVKWFITYFHLDETGGWVTVLSTVALLVGIRLGFVYFFSSAFMSILIPVIIYQILKALCLELQFDQRFTPLGTCLILIVLRVAFLTAIDTSVKNGGAGVNATVSAV